MNTKLSTIDLVDQVRAMPQTGLAFATDPHEKDRYTKLLELAVEEYERVSMLLKGDFDDNKLEASS